MRAKQDDPNRSARLKIHDLMDQHCKDCTAIAGLRGSNRSQDWSKSCDICNACEIGKELQELGKPLYTVSEERKRLSIGECFIKPEEERKPVAARTKQRGRIVPAKIAAVESTSKGSGKCESRFLTPEELEEVRRKYDKPGTRNGKGDESVDKRQKEGPGNGLTRRTFLEGIANGETVSSLERAYGLKNQTLGYWVGKWGYRGLGPGKARELLGELEVEKQAAAPAPDEPKQPTGTDTQPPPVPEPPAESAEPDKDAEIERLRAEILDWQIDWQESDLQRAEEIQHWKAAAAETEQRLITANEELKRDLAEREQEINSLTEQLAAYQVRAKVEQAGPITPPYPFPTVTLTYALIDFGGNRIEQRLKVLEEANEYIAELEASNIDLTRTVSELFDAGQSFVGLIRKQLQELMVDDPDSAVLRYFSEHNRLHLEKMVEKVKKIHA